MSETPQGPGWWQASDGRYYPPGAGQSGPPQPAPGYSPAYPPNPHPQNPYPQNPYPPGGGKQPIGSYPPGGYGPGHGTPLPPPRRSGGRGCITSIVMVVVLLAGVALAGRWAWGRATAWFDDKTENLVGGSGCPYITDAEVTAIVGGDKVTLVTTGKLTTVVSGALDGRVIPDAPSCWAVSSTSGSAQNTSRVLRIANQSGTGAAATFAAEVKKAKNGTTVGQSNGPGVSVGAYYNKPVRGLGDEAFCTKGLMSGSQSAGVLVRDGDRLVYVSLSSDLSTLPGVGTPGRTAMSGDDATCEVAQKIARVVLTH